MSGSGPHFAVLLDNSAYAEAARVGQAVQEVVPSDTKVGSQLHPVESAPVTAEETRTKVGDWAF
jgi:hypothetical protein